LEAYWFASPPGNVGSIENHPARELSDAAGRHRPGSAALVQIQGDKVAAELVFGIANASTQSRVNSGRTLYQLAPVSKAVTAWGVMKLVEDVRLCLDVSCP